MCVTAYGRASWEKSGGTCEVQGRVDKNYDWLVVRTSWILEYWPTNRSYVCVFVIIMIVSIMKIIKMCVCVFVTGLTAAAMAELQKLQKMKMMMSLQNGNESDNDDLHSNTGVTPNLHHE